jgi:hypothetical protein
MIDELILNRLAPWSTITNAQKSEIRKRSCLADVRLDVVEEQSGEVFQLSGIGVELIAERDERLPLRVGQRHRMQMSLGHVCEEETQ